jgi:hypothetical protein
MQMSAPVVTYKQAAFAKAVALGTPLADAYREAYTVVAMSSNAVRVEASRLAKNPDVALMVRALQEQASVRHQVTTDSLLAEADTAYRMAYDNEDPSAMIAATRLKSMLTGLLVRPRDTADAALSAVPDNAIYDELVRLSAQRAA